MAVVDTHLWPAAGGCDVDRAVPERSGWLARAKDFWRELARPVDYPQNEQEWLALIGRPVVLTGPFDYGVAIGPMLRPGGAGRSALGSLLWSYKHRDDDQAAEILAAVLARFLEYRKVHDEYDAIIPVPPSFRSRPGPPVTTLLSGADRPLPLPVWPEVVTRTAAMAPQREDAEAGAQSGRDESLFAVDESVAGKRVLLLDDSYNTGETVSALVHALRARGASRVGVVVICSAPGRSDD